jgi:hypothetical protein
MQVVMSWPGTDAWIGECARFTNDISLKVMEIAGRKIIQDSHRVEKELFANAGSTGKHGKWKENTPKYLEWKLSHSAYATPMILSGNLMKSLISQTSESIATVEKIGQAWHIKFGTDVKSADGFDYPLYHQTGSDIKGKTPQRRTIDPTNKNMFDWLKIIQMEVVGSSYRHAKLFDRVSINRPPTFDRGM